MCGEFRRWEGKIMEGSETIKNETRLFGPEDPFMDCELKTETLFL